jgi:DNA primase
MYLWSCGIPSVATGTASVSKEQVQLLKRSPIETLVIASDSDKAGAKMEQMVVNALGGFMTLKRLVHPAGVKDVNDMTPGQLETAVIAEINFFTPK